jgi:hypothetical protein
MRRFLIFLSFLIASPFALAGESKMILNEGYVSWLGTVEDASKDGQSVTLSFNPITYDAHKFYPLASLRACSTVSRDFSKVGARVLVKDESGVLRTATIQTTPCEGYFAVLFDSEFTFRTNRIYSVEQLQFNQDKSR